MTLTVLLIVLAIIAFVVAATGFTWRKLDLIAVGLALLTLSFLLGRLSHLSLGTLIVLLSFLAFAAAALGWKYRKVNLIAAGLALYTLSLIVG